MCGILGIFFKNLSKKCENVKLNSLRNRGPDGIGQFIDGSIGLFHTRLAVIDQKETSNQPILSQDKHYALICNGEIYNYKELKLKYPAYKYCTTSDCEVIIACYVTEGVAGFRNLKGMFSFGLYDSFEKKLFICRDSIGKKPLFIYEGNELLTFSSSVTAIKDNVSVKLDISKEAVDFYLKQGFIRPDISLYSQIKSVLPGTLLEVDLKNKSVTSQYINPESNNYQNFQYNSGTIFQEAKRLLEISIQRRATSIKNLVLLFSGGIDSTVLARGMSLFCENKPICISLKPLIPMTYDDLFARYAAKRLNLQCIPVGFPLRNLMEDICNTISLLDQPLSLYSFYCLVYLTRKARDFGNVLFLGEGGDEVFYGYSKIQDWFEPNKTSESDSKKFLVGPKPNASLSPWGMQQITTHLLGHSFVKVDKATAEQQMEARCPYLDWDLMYFVRSVPEKYFIEAGVTKYLLKQIINDFPPWFINRRKIGTHYNFRYLMFPLYRKIYNEIKWEYLMDLFPNSIRYVPFSFKHMFLEFDRFWKLFVLSKVLANQGL